MGTVICYTGLVIHLDCTMSDLFEFFSPKLPKKNPKANLVVTAVTADKQAVEIDEACIDANIRGIVNQNYESSVEVDGVSIDSLTVALYNLEEKKKSLEEEIDKLYKTDIGLDDLIDLVNQILSISRVAVPSSVEQEDIVEVDECFDMLKSAAAFVERRLGKIKTKPKPDKRITADGDRVGHAHFGEDILSPIKVASADNDDDIEGDVKSDAQLKEECVNVQINDIEYDDTEAKIDSLDTQNENENGVDAKRVSYEDFVNNMDDKKMDGKYHNFERNQKTRWSLKRVFRKKK